MPCPVQPWGCKGRSPLHKNNLKSPPSPPGKSALRARVGGIGAKKYTKGRAERQPQPPRPRRGQRRQGHPATLGQAPRQRAIRRPCSGAARVQSPGICSARSVSAAGGSVPGCRGRSPRRNKLCGSPFPTGEGGWGDGGQEGKLKAGQGGNPGASPPPARDTPPLFRCARVQPPGTCSARSVSAAGGSAQGCRGRSPLHKNNLKSPPSPSGKGAGGIGGKIKAKGRAGRHPQPPRPRRGQRRQGQPATPGQAPPPYLNFTKPIRPADCRSAFFCV